MKKKTTYLVDIAYTIGNVDHNTIIPTTRQYEWKYIKYLLVNQLIYQGYANPSERKRINQMINILRVSYNINED